MDEQTGASRRDFIKTAGAAFGAVGLGLGGLQSAAAQGLPNDCAPPKPTKPPVPFKSDPSLPMRVRKSAFELSTQEIDKLKAAYKALRALTQSQPNNPIGWMQQANVHCWYCGGGNDGKQGEEIHESWWFFPWHRCYLYFHERILGKLINDPTLALPYWDWNTVGRNVLAPPYVTPNTTANPLFDKLRGQTPTAKIPAAYVGAQTMQTVMSAPTTTAFMGTPNTASQPVGGSLENGPHGSVHVWTGTQQTGLDMGILATAARDPIFFCHHGNIDRLWDVWLAGSATHKNPTATAWLDHSWDFYDENGVWTSISVRDVINHEQSLRYRYQPPRSILRTPGPNALLSQDVAVAADMRAPLQAAAVAAPTHALRIQGLAIPPTASAVVNVFANLPGAGRDTGTDNTHFVGTFAVIAKGAGHDHGTKTVDIPIPATAAVQFAEDQVSVTLVPVDGTVKPADVKFDKATVVPIE